MANLQNKGINSLFFTDKLHGTTKPTLTSGCSDGQRGLPPVDRTSFPLTSEGGGRVVQANVQNKGVSPVLFAVKLYKATKSGIFDSVAWKGHLRYAIYRVHFVRIGRNLDTIKI